VVPSVASTARAGAGSAAASAMGGSGPSAAGGVQSRGGEVAEAGRSAASSRRSRPASTRLIGLTRTKLAQAARIAASPASSTPQTRGGGNMLSTSA
jgi:hypothetical protein